MSNTESSDGFIKLEIVGLGGFGEAWKVQCKSKKEIFIMKTIPCYKIDTNDIIAFRYLKCHSNMKLGQLYF